MTIDKVGAVILNDEGQMLVVRKQVPGRHTFIIPGGQRETGESDEQTCRRELLEELGTQVVAMDYFGTYEEPSEFEDAALRATVYRVEIKGDPTPTSEIVELAWVDGTSLAAGVEVGSVVARHVLPRLVGEGLVKPA
ncbi:NUDIX domain-containing protein [Streptomyces sp. NPDC048415]|uniref:NUDIX hydrolase n=1 Tax=Streptomyces sp. NPDC048415 TaxID=3154822 RepID=UPI0034446BC9